MVIPNNKLSLDEAEAIYDRVFNDPASTYNDRLVAVVQLSRRGWRSPATGEQAIQDWIAKNPPQQTEA